MTRTLVLVQAATTLPLVGLIWTVQWVQYPGFAKVGEAAFSAYHAEHSRRITWIVLPAMLAELGAALLLVTRIEAPVDAISAWLGLTLVGVIWLSTACLQVPKHRVLSTGFEASAHRLLVGSNWLRTVAWSLRGGLVIWWLSRL